MTRRLLRLVLGLLLAACAWGARAEYCTDQDWGAQPFMPDGACDELGSASLSHAGGRSRLTLHAERGLLPPGSARATELVTMLSTVAARVGTAMNSLGTLRLPAQVHLVVVDDSRGETVYAQALPVSATAGCPVLIFQSAMRSIPALTRSVTHELFHCMQYETWPDKTTGSDFLWWAEGSAVWFEDYVFPEHFEQATTGPWVSDFRLRSPTVPITELAHGNVVLFAWLGPLRVMSFLQRVGGTGMSRTAAAAQAMDIAMYRAFAKDYVEGRIGLPSGTVVAGDTYGALVPDLGRTTGEPGADPAILRRGLPAFLLFRGRLSFAPGVYDPQGQFARETERFAEVPGRWEPLPHPLQAGCGADRHFKVADIAARIEDFVMDPRPRATATPPCPCPNGSWTIPRGELKQLSPAPNLALESLGEVRLEFRADGTASFVASQLRFGPLSQTAQGLRGNTASASTTITRSWEYHWTWQAAGSRLTMEASSPGVVSEYALSVLTVPEMPAQLVRKRFRHELPDIPTPERIKYFVCEGGQLKISTSANRNPTYYRYPHFGVFVREWPP